MDNGGLAYGATDHCVRWRGTKEVEEMCICAVVGKVLKNCIVISLKTREVVVGSVPADYVGDEVGVVVGVMEARKRRVLQLQIQKAVHKRIR